MRSQVPVILALVVVAVLGQLLIKSGLDRTGALEVREARDVIHSLGTIAGSPRILAGLLLYAVSSYVWLVVLSKVDLSFAFPFVALTYVLVLAASVVVLGEPLRANRIVGSLLIVAGVVVVGLR